jgi:hypothetical protein
MPAPTIRFWKKKAILFKLEGAYGVDAAPTGALNGVEGRNVSLSPFEADVEERGVVRPYMGNGSKLITGKRLKLAFDAALAASGAAGVAPKIGPLLRACGWAETVTADVDVAYAPISSGFESATFYVNIDGVLHKGTGARGTTSFKLDKGIPLLHVELTALFVAPADAAPPAVDLSAWPVEAPVNSRNTLVCTLDAVDSWYSKFEFAQNNQVAHDDYPGGYEAISIKDRAPTASMLILAPSLAVFNPFELAEAATLIPVQVVHGTTAGNKVQVDLQTRVTGAAYEDMDGSVGYNLTLSPDPDAGDDEMQLTFL